MIYAGQGTFWTDLKGFEQTFMAKTASDTTQAKPTKANLVPTAGGNR